MCQNKVVNNNFQLWSIHFYFYFVISIFLSFPLSLIKIILSLFIKYILMIFNYFLLNNHLSQSDTKFRHFLFELRVKAFIINSFWVSDDYIFIQFYVNASSSLWAISWTIWYHSMFLQLLPTQSRILTSLQGLNTQLTFLHQRFCYHLNYLLFTYINVIQFGEARFSEFSNGSEPIFSYNHKELYQWKTCAWAEDSF